MLAPPLAGKFRVDFTAGTAIIPGLTVIVHPTVTAVAPLKGSVSGGQTIVVKGAGFVPPVSVAFNPSSPVAGSSASASVQPTSITVQTPPAYNSEPRSPAPFPSPSGRTRSALILPPIATNMSFPARQELTIIRYPSTCDATSPMTFTVVGRKPDGSPDDSLTFDVSVDAEGNLEAPLRSSKIFWSRRSTAAVGKLST